jgi:predicted site-specific integrase-resolvase
VKLQVHPRTIRNWIASGYFKGWFKLKSRWRITEKNVDKFLEERAKNGK